MPSDLPGNIPTSLYSKGYYAAMYCCSLFFTAISVIAYLYPGKNGAQAIFYPIMIFLLFALLGIVTVVVMADPSGSPLL